MPRICGRYVDNSGWPAPFGRDGKRWEKRHGEGGSSEKIRRKGRGEEGGQGEEGSAACCQDAVEGQIQDNEKGTEKEGARQGEQARDEKSDEENTRQKGRWFENGGQKVGTQQGCRWKGAGDADFETETGAAA